MSNELSNLGTYRVNSCFSSHPRVLLWKGSENGAEKGNFWALSRDTVGHTGVTNRGRSRVHATILENFQKQHTGVDTVWSGRVPNRVTYLARTETRHGLSHG